jgi:hypothetical protein
MPLDPKGFNRSMIKIPYRFHRAVFTIQVTGFASAMVSGLTTWRNMGLTPDFFSHWIPAWLASWPVAFPSMYAVTPLAQRLAGKLCAPPPSAPPKG